MKIVNVRSPFIIQIDQFGQLGSKIELFIWNNGSTEPIAPTYTLSKPIPTATQTLTSYNVSNFVKEYINNIAPDYGNWIGIDDSNTYALFKVKRYWDNAGVYTLLDTTSYVGVNGFTNYMDGLQVATNTKFKLLFNNTIKNNYYLQSTYPTDTIQYLNVLAEFLSPDDNLRIAYNRIDGTSYVQNIDFGEVTGIYMLTIPISLAKIDNNFINGVRVDLIYTPDGENPLPTQSFYTYPICEPKYTPVLCDFVNRFGGWQTMTFYKAQTNNISVKNDDYKLSPDEVNYDVKRGQNRSFNFIGTQIIKVNTGWIEENYNELITDLLMSEKVLIDGKPVILKTSSSELKTKLKNRLINYEVEFQYSYNLINDVV